MTQWSIWGGFMKKPRGQKSRATVPLNKGYYVRDRMAKCRLRRMRQTNWFWKESDQ